MLLERIKMTNGNDIVEYEEQCCQQLQEDWCQKIGVKIENLDDDKWVEENIENNQQYWDYVTDEYSEAGADREPDDM